MLRTTLNPQRAFAIRTFQAGAWWECSLIHISVGKVKATAKDTVAPAMVHTTRTESSTHAKKTEDIIRTRVSVTKAVVVHVIAWPAPSVASKEPIFTRSLEVRSRRLKRS